MVKLLLSDKRGNPSYCSQLIFQEALRQKDTDLLELLLADDRFVIAENRLRYAYLALNAGAKFGLVNVVSLLLSEK